VQVNRSTCVLALLTSHSAAGLVKVAAVSHFGSCKQRIEWANGRWRITSAADLVGPGVNLLPERIVLLWPIIEMQNNKLDAAARFTWTSNVENAMFMNASDGLRTCLWGAMKPLQKNAVNECKQQNKSKNYLFINVV
jgi:hypothetical protein